MLNLYIFYTHVFIHDIVNVVKKVPQKMACVKMYEIPHRKLGLSTFKPEENLTLSKFLPSLLIKYIVIWKLGVTKEKPITQ